MTTSTRALLTGHERAAWDALGTRHLTVRPADKTRVTADEIVDLDGVLRGWMRGFGVRVVALRLDRYVAATDTSGLAVPD